MAPSSFPPGPAPPFHADFFFLMSAMEEGQALFGLGREYVDMRCCVLGEALQILGHDVQVLTAEATSEWPGTIVRREQWCIDCVTVTSLTDGYSNSMVNMDGMVGMHAIEAEMKDDVATTMIDQEDAIPEDFTPIPGAPRWAPPVSTPSQRPRFQEFVARAVSLLQAQALQAGTAPKPAAPRTRL